MLLLGTSTSSTIAKRIKPRSSKRLKVCYQSSQDQIICNNLALISQIEPKNIHKGKNDEN